MRRPLIKSDRRRKKLRLTLSLAAAAAVAGSVAQFAIGGGGDTAASASQVHSRFDHRAMAAAPTQSVRSQSTAFTSCGSSSAASNLWSSALKPAVAASRSTLNTTLGVQVVPSKAGSITGVAFWKGAGNTGTHTAAVWSGGKQLASGTFTKETASGWQWLTLAHPVQVKAGQMVLATYQAPNGHFAFTPNAFPRGGICSGPLRALDGFRWSSQTAGHLDPRSQYTSHDDWYSTSHGANYFVDVRFAPANSTPSPTTKPTTPKPTTPSATATTPKPTAQPTTPKPTAQPTTAKPTAQPTTPKPTATSTGGTTLTGWPTAANTGVPAGTKLHSCSGSLNASGTYDACQFSGGVSIGANNVHITRSLINGQVTAGDGKQTGLVISDTEINCHCMSTGGTTPPAVAFSNFTLLRDNIHNAGHGVQINNNATVQDTYIHDLGANNSAHKDAIISNGGGNAVIKHNNVECAADSCSAAIGLFGDFAPIKNWTITDNLLNTTGSYCLYGGDSPGKPYSTATGMVITNNHFGKKDWPGCGQYGPVTAFDHNSGNSWSGNVWDGTNTAINP